MQKSNSILFAITVIALMFGHPAKAFDQEHIEKLEERVAEIETFLDDRFVDIKRSFVRLGGAGRIQYSYKDWDQGSRKRFGDISLDVFRLNFSGKYNNLKFSSEYRFYPTDSWHAPHHAWVGYKFSENLHTEVGIHQVPFGILPYASHSFWLSGAYYLGLEDDYDMGAKVLYKYGPWDFSFGAYKNEELGNAGNAERYSIDLINNADGGYAGAQADGNQETNQLNFRGAYTFKHGPMSSTTIGASAEVGQIYNNNLNENGGRWAGALHMNGQYGRFGLQLQWIRFQNNPKYTAGLDTDISTMGAYSFSWGVPNEADIAMANVSYTESVNFGPLDSITFYLDNTLIEPEKSRFHSIWQNTVGSIFVAGPVFAYLDIISGKNMIFSGGNMVDSLDEGRTTRVNVNIGYYF